VDALTDDQRSVGSAFIRTSGSTRPVSKPRSCGFGARQGRDFRAEQKQGRLATATFAETFDTFLAIREQKLSNGKHARQWRNTMRD
jgi:hypothetical protein